MKPVFGGYQRRACATSALLSFVSPRSHRRRGGGSGASRRGSVPSLQSVQSGQAKQPFSCLVFCRHVLTRSRVLSREFHPRVASFCGNVWFCFWEWRSVACWVLSCAVRFEFVVSFSRVSLSETNFVVFTESVGSVSLHRVDITFRAVALCAESLDAWNTASTGRYWAHRRLVLDATLVLESGFLGVPTLSRFLCHLLQKHDTQQRCVCFRSADDTRQNVWNHCFCFWHACVCVYVFAGHRVENVPGRTGVRRLTLACEYVV